MYILQVGLFFSQTESNQGPSFSPFTSSFCVLCAHSDTFYVLKLAHSNWKHKQSLKTLNQCLKKFLNAKIRNFFTYLGPIFFPKAYFLPSPYDTYPLNYIHPCDEQSDSNMGVAEVIFLLPFVFFIPLIGLYISFMVCPSISFNAWHLVLIYRKAKVIYGCCSHAPAQTVDSIWVLVGCQGMSSSCRY